MAEILKCGKGIMRHKAGAEYTDDILFFIFARKFETFGHLKNEEAMLTQEFKTPEHQTTL